MRQEQKRCLGHPDQATANRVAQPVVARPGAIIKDIPPSCVDHGKMHMRAVTWLIGIGLGHKGRDHAVGAGQPLDHVLEQNRIIGSAPGVSVMEVDLELANTGLGDRGLGIDAHSQRGPIERGEKPVEGVQFGQRQDLGPIQSSAPLRRVRRSDTIVGRFGEVKFQLDGGQHRPAAFGVSVKDAVQRMTRVAVKG